jgi:hypothetical protein
MGNFFTFSIEPSNDPQLNFGEKTCDEGIKITKDFIAKKIIKIKSIKNFENTKDFKKYGLYPGQLLTRPSRFGPTLPHSAFYICDGIIVEMGSGPSKCRRGPQSPLLMENNIIGLSTLREFKKWANKNKTKITIENINTNSANSNGIRIHKDSANSIGIRRLKKILKLIGHWKYNAFSANCMHMADLVTKT